MKEILSYLYFGVPGVCSSFLRTYIANKWANHQVVFVQWMFIISQGPPFHIPYTTIPIFRLVKICVSSTSQRLAPGPKSRWPCSLDIQTPPQKVFGHQKHTIQTPFTSGVIWMSRGCSGFKVLIYYWDERDGPNFHGWWFGPKAQVASSFGTEGPTMRRRSRIFKT